MIKATIDDLKELLDLNLEQIYTLKLLEKKQKLEQINRRHNKSNPLIILANGEEVYPNQIEALNEVIDSWLPR